MSGRHWVVIVIGAVWGVCFATLAARCIGDAWVNPRFRVYSVIYAVITTTLAYLAFRTATSGRTDEEGFMHSLWGGFAGAVLGLIIIFVVLALFRENARTYFARPLGLHLSQVTNFRLVAAFLFLGFGAGFAIRTKAERDSDL